MLEVVCASLLEAHMPTSYWGEALTSAIYLINRVPSQTLQFQTPFQTLHNSIHAPTISNLPPRVFGCVAFVHLHKHQRSKLTPQALRCVFLGYAKKKKGIDAIIPQQIACILPLMLYFIKTKYISHLSLKFRGSTVTKFKLWIILILRISFQLS